MERRQDTTEKRQEETETDVRGLMRHTRKNTIFVSGKTVGDIADDDFEEWIIATIKSKSPYNQCKVER